MPTLSLFFLVTLRLAANNKRIKISQEGKWVGSIPKQVTDLDSLSYENKEIIFNYKEDIIYNLNKSLIEKQSYLQSLQHSLQKTCELELAKTEQKGPIDKIEVEVKTEEDDPQ